MTNCPSISESEVSFLCPPKLSEGSTQDTVSQGHTYYKASRATALTLPGPFTISGRGWPQATEFKRKRMSQRLRVVNIYSRIYSFIQNGI